MLYIVYRNLSGIHRTILLRQPRSDDSLFFIWSVWYVHLKELSKFSPKYLSWNFCCKTSPFIVSGWCGGIILFFALNKMKLVFDVLIVNKLYWNHKKRVFKSVCACEIRV